MTTSLPIRRTHGLRANAHGKGRVAFVYARLPRVRTVNRERNNRVGHGIGERSLTLSHAAPVNCLRLETRKN